MANKNFKNHYIFFISVENQIFVKKNQYENAAHIYIALKNKIRK